MKGLYISQKFVQRIAPTLQERARGGKSDRSLTRPADYFLRMFGANFLPAAIPASILKFLTLIYLARDQSYYSLDPNVSMISLCKYTVFLSQHLALTRLMHPTNRHTSPSNRTSFGDPNRVSMSVPIGSRRSERSKQQSRRTS